MGSVTRYALCLLQTPTPSDQGTSHLSPPTWSLSPANPQSSKWTLYGNNKHEEHTRWLSWFITIITIVYDRYSYI